MNAHLEETADLTNKVIYMPTSYGYFISEKINGLESVSVIGLSIQIVICASVVEIMLQFHVTMRNS